MTTTAPPELAKTDAARNALDLRMILVDEIAADPGQPRKYFGTEKLDELAASLKQEQTSAIRVRPRGAGENFPPEIKWVLMHGERRLRAAVRAEIPRLRAEVAWDVGHGDTDVILLEQIADNLQREDLNAVEEAAGIRRYAKLSKLGTREIAAKIGKNQMYVSHALAMEKMPADVVKRIERDARGTSDVEPYALTWKHLRQLLRLTDQPERLTETYNDAVMDRSTARELEAAISWTLEEIERERQRVERAEAEATTKGAASDTVDQPAPLSALDQKDKDDRLDRARMTRARKDVIRGMMPDVVHQVARIAKGIRLPDGLAQLAADRVRGNDVWQLVQQRGEGTAYTSYGEDLAQLVVPELPGEWGGWAGRKGTSLGSALNAGGLAKDNEAGRQWLGFIYWLATETKGLDKGLDRAAANLLKDRDKGAAERAAKKATKATPAKAAKAAPTWSNALVCARDDCNTTFHIQQGHKGRRPKYCPEHRSR
jgi:ParB family chromosome partitioning protein